MANETERRQIRALLWAFWGGLLVSTAGECVLFAMMTPVGASPPQTAVLVLGALGTIMLTVAGLAGHHRVAGDGVPTALIVWLLLKGISVLGLVAYQLTAIHWLFWPFVGTFVSGMAWWWPRRFMGDAG
jgi:hypothetical protein